MNDDAKRVTYFAETDSRNRKLKFGIKKIDRSKHMYVIGKTGMGKSTLLENLAIQDIQNGEGLAFIDPHGNTADLLLEYVPEHRIKDVLYFAPFDMEYPVSFNVMEDIGAERRHLVVNGLMSAFKKIWVDAWSARMEYILNNIMLALLEYPGSTLLGVNRMLADKDFRKKVVENITDPSVRSFWVDEYANYSERFAQDAAPAIQNKVGQFVTNPLVRNIIGQANSTFNIRQMMDEKKILIINLSKGRVGEANANLLGSMLVTKIYLAAMSRADANEQELANLPNFYLYVDEFQSFANESFADILSEARKYKLNLTIAHQYIEQMPEEVRAAVFGNVGTMITFRVGAYDAEVLEKEYMPQFTATDIVSLGRFQAYMKLMIDGVTSTPFSAATLPRIAKPEYTFRKEIIEHSRRMFARPRIEVEEEIKAWHLEGNEGKGEKGQGGQGGRDGGRGGQGGGSRDGGRSGGSDRGGQGGSHSGGGQRRDGGMSQGPRDGGSRDGSRGGQGNGQKGPARDSRDNAPRDGAPRDGGTREGSAPRDQQRGDQQRKDGVSREKEMREAFSLSYLKSQREKQDNSQKVAKPENVLALREALLSVVKEVRPDIAEEIENKQAGKQSVAPAEPAEASADDVPTGAPVAPAKHMPHVYHRAQPSPEVPLVAPAEPKPHFDPSKVKHQPRPFIEELMKNSEKNSKTNDGKPHAIYNTSHAKAVEHEVPEEVLKKLLNTEE